MSFFAVALLILFFVPMSHSWAQGKVIAQYSKHDTSKKSLLGPNVVDNPLNVNTDDNTYATLYASPGGLLALGNYTSFIEVKFPNEIKANTWSYVELSGDSDLFSALLGGTLGKTLSDLLGAILLGKQEIKVEAINNANTTVLTASSNGSSGSGSGIVYGFNTDRVRLIENKEGKYLLAINPDQDYRSIKISNKALSLVGLFTEYKIDVYKAFTYTSGSSASCGKPLGTSYDGAGISLDLLQIQSQRLNAAIDDSLDTYSLLQSGSLVDVNVGGHISQYFYFPTTSSPESTFNIKLGANTGLLNLDLLAGIEVNAYKGSTLVYSKSLKGGLLNGVDILGLIGGSTPGTLTFAPGKAFDKVEVRLNKGVTVGVASGGVRIYDVQRYYELACVNPNYTIPVPTSVPFETPSCSTSLLDFDNVDFAYNAIDNNNESYATLYADDGTLLSSAAKTGMIHLGYSNVVPANTTSYIRIDMEKEVLEKLLGGTLGQVVDGVLGLVIGKHYFDVKAFDGATLVTESVSNNGFSSTTGGTVTLVQDNIGRYYIAVTPSAKYNSIKITNKSTSLLSTGKPAVLKVYNMCREIGKDACLAPQFTSYNQQGLSLSVAGLNGAGVTNPYYAISGNSSEFSEISVGTVGVAAMVKQTIYFGQPSIVGDEVKVRLQFNPNSLLSADVLGRYRIVTYLGGEEKESFILQQGLINNLDLLALFKSGGIQTLSFPTTQVFDRVEIQVGTILSAGVTAPVRLYSVKRVSENCPEIKTASPFIAPVCASKIIDAANANDLDNLFDDDFDSYATLESGAGFLLGINKHEGFVELGYDNVVPANTTSYVRIDFEGSELKKLLSGSLGNLVSGIVDGLLLGDHSFTIDVKDANGTTILKQGSQNITSSYNAGKIRVVIDKLGRTYLAITPTQAYKSVRITDNTNSVVGLLAKPNTMNVYGMCYETTTNNCTDAFVTSYEYSGINLSVNALGGAGVTYPERAIDGNSTHGSQITLGTIAVGSTVKQWIDFTTLSEPNEITNIRLKVGTGGVTVPLLESLRIAAYNDETFVEQLNWNNGLVQGVDVINLLNSSQAADIPFQINGQYNRIVIELKNLVNVGVFPPVEVYSVERLCKPAGSNQSLVTWKSYKINGDETLTSVYGGEEVEYTIHVKNVSNTPVSGIVITDNIPVGMEFVSSTQGQEANGLVTFNIPTTIAPGAVQTFTFVVNVIQDLQGIIEIKNIAFSKVGTETSYPSYPPLNNENPTTPDVSKQPGTIIKVSTTLPLLVKAVITSDKANALCSNTEFTLDSNIDTADADTYQWYFNGELIDSSLVSNGNNTNVNFGKEKTLTTSSPGKYTVVYTKGGSLSEVSDEFIVTEILAPVITIIGSQQIMTVVNTNITLPTATANNGIIKWYDTNGNVITASTASFSTPGIYTYTVVAENNGCSSYKNIIVTVYDSSLCPPKVERIYAKGSSTWGSIITGGVTDTANTIDNNPKTHSTIVTGVGLLGIGTAWQDVKFENEVPAGTPVTIKLGKEYSGLVVGGGITVQGLDGSNVIIGVAQSVQGGLLDLLASDNVIEFTFVPSNISGPKAYKGVRITLGALVSVAQLAKVYSVYYNKSVVDYSSNYCAPVVEDIHASVLDVLHGVEDIGLGVASATASVSDAWNAVDNDLTSYAMISRGVAVANRATLTVVLKQQAMPGDQIQIIIENPGNPILSLELIKGYTIQRYLGQEKVGDVIDGTSGVDVLGLKLLGLGYNNKFKMIVKETDKPFDRVKIAYGSVVGVLGDFTKVFDVSVLPKIKVDGIEDITSDILGVCNDGYFIIKTDASQACDTYKVYKEATGGIPLIEQSINTYKIPKGLKVYRDILDNQGTLGPQYSVLYVQVYRNGCEVGTRIPVRLDIKNCGVKSNLNITHKIK